MATEALDSQIKELMRDFDKLPNEVIVSGQPKAAAKAYVAEPSGGDRAAGIARSINRWRVA